MYNLYGVKAKSLEMTKHLEVMTYRTGSPDLGHIDPTVIRGNSGEHPAAITAVLAAASLAGDSPWSEEYLRRFRNTPPRRGKRRCCDNCLHFFCLMMPGGVYRVY